MLLGGIGITIDNEAGTVEITVPGFGTVVKTSFSRPEDMRRFTAEEIRGLLDTLMGLAGGGDEGNVPGADDKKDPQGEEGEGGDEGAGTGEGEGEPLNEHEIVEKIIDWLENESTSDDQNTANEQTRAGGGGGGDGNQGVPTPPDSYQHNGHAVAIVDATTEDPRGQDRGAGPRAIEERILHTHDDAGNSQDWYSDYLQFNTEDGSPGQLGGNGSLTLTTSPSTDTGPMTFAEAGETRADPGDYEFNAEFADGSGDSVDDLLGNIETANEPLDTPGGEVGRSSQWWNWGVWDINFDQDSTIYTPSVEGEPTGYWIAGVRTPRDYILSQISSEVTGTWSGGARCIKSEVGRGSTEYAGSSDFLVDFGARSVAGDLDFTDAGGPTMDLSATINPSGRGFLGAITDVTSADRVREVPVSSTLRGDFFGPTASSLGGTFDAVMSGASYIGVFGADAAD